jgi:hypothetical protein
MTNPYQAAFEQSINDPDGFWAKAAEDCHWYKRWDKVLDDSNKPFYRWFTGGEINTCYNALDYHIDQGRGDQLALIYDSPVTDTITKYTYNQLRDEVAKFAGVLKAQGVEKGDRVLIYMPMIAEAAMAMLACARIGAVHSVVFGGFAAKELATRINDAKPKVIVTASCGIEVKKVIAYKPLLDAAIDMSDSKPEKCVIFQRPMEKGVHDRRKGRGLGGSHGRRQPGGLCAGGGHGPAVHSLHLGHDGPAQGRGAGQRRPRGGAEMDHEKYLQRGCRRCLLGGLGCRLGGGPQLYRLRPVVQGLHHHPVRRKTGGYAGCRGLLAGDCRPQGQGHVYRADGLSGHQARGPQCRTDEKVRPVQLQGPVSGRRAPRPQHPALGRRRLEGPGGGPLVADGDGLGHLRQLPGSA